MYATTRWLAVILGATLWLGDAQAAQPDEPPRPICPICSRANEDTAAYPSKAVATLGRGAANTFLGWTELIRQPAQEAKAGGNVLIGIGKGVGYGVTRTLAGVGELLTFWSPKVQDRYLRFATDCPVCFK